MNPLDKMITQFKTIEELQAFAKAQQKSLIDMSKKLKTLEDENTKLKKASEGAITLVSPKKVDFSANDDETIARQQLVLLKQFSEERDLTLEETKRVEIYSKILASFKEKEKKSINVSSRTLSTEELEAVVTANEDYNDGRNDQH